LTAFHDQKYSALCTSQQIDIECIIDFHKRSTKLLVHSFSLVTVGNFLFYIYALGTSSINYGCKINERVKELIAIRKINAVENFNAGKNYANQWCQQ